jgi:hypothetical protein
MACMHVCLCACEIVIFWLVTMRGIEFACSICMFVCMCVCVSVCRCNSKICMHPCIYLCTCVNRTLHVSGLDSSRSNKHHFSSKHTYTLHTYSHAGGRNQDRWHLIISGRSHSGRFDCCKRRIRDRHALYIWEERHIRAPCAEEDVRQRRCAAWVYVCMCVRMHECEFVFVCMYVYIMCVCACACKNVSFFLVYVCIYVHSFTY